MEVKNRKKAREILLSMLWMLEEPPCKHPRISRKQFAKKYKCQDKNGVFC